MRAQHSLMKAVLVPIAFLGTILHAQEIHIKLLNGRNGKPIKDECVNLWFGKVRGGSFIAPANDEGIVVLHIADHQVSAEAVQRNPCARVASIGPASIQETDAMYVWPDNYAACQEYGKHVAGEPIENKVPENLTPSYSLTQIVSSGVVASNTCGKVEAAVKPGELIYFVRPLTFWEKLRL